MPTADAKQILYGPDAATAFWSKPKSEQIKQLTALDPSTKDESPEVWNEFLTQAHSIADQKGIFKPVVAQQSQPPQSRGVMHALARGGSESIAAVDQFAESAFGGISRIIPGETPITSTLSRWGKENRERREKELAEDEDSGGAPQTRAEKIAESAAGSVGDIALLAGTRSPAGVALVEGIKHLNEGPGSAAESAIEGYMGGKALQSAGRLVQKIPGVRKAATAAVKDAEQAVSNVGHEPPQVRTADGTKPLWKRPVTTVRVEGGTKPLFPKKPGQVAAEVRGPQLPKGQLDSEIGGSPKWKPNTAGWEPGSPEPPPTRNQNRPAVLGRNPVPPGKVEAVNRAAAARTAAPPAVNAEAAETERLASYDKRAQEWAQKFGKQASEYQQSEEGQRHLAESLVDDLEKKTAAHPPDESKTPARTAIKRATRKSAAPKKEVIVEGKTKAPDSGLSAEEAEVKSTENPAVESQPEATTGAGESNTGKSSVHEPTRSTIEGIIKDASRTTNGQGSIQISNAAGHSVDLDLATATPEQINHAASVLGESKILSIRPVGESHNLPKMWSRTVEEAKAPTVEPESGLPEEHAEATSKRSYKGLTRGTGMKFLGPSKEEDGLFRVEITSGPAEGKSYLFSREDLNEIFGR